MGIGCSLVGRVADVAFRGRGYEHAVELGARGGRRLECGLAAEARGVPRALHRAFLILAVRARQDLEEMLGNLLDNACKWANSTIVIGYHELEQGHQFIISDDGPGIKPELADQLLKRGARADESTAGHGIGLSIVHDIVDAYDGDIRINSSASGGTEITITL